MTHHHAADHRFHDPESSTYVLLPPRGFDQCHYRGCTAQAVVGWDRVDACEQHYRLLVGEDKRWGPGDDFDPTVSPPPVNKPKAVRRRVGSLYYNSASHRVLEAIDDGCTRADITQRYGKAKAAHAVSICRAYGWVKRDRWALTAKGAKLLAEAQAEWGRK